MLREVTLGEVVFTEEPWGPFTYRIPSQWSYLRVGVRVKVPLRKSFRVGLLVEVKRGEDQSHFKDIIHPYDEVPVLEPLQLDLTRWMAEYYLCEWGEILSAALPQGLKPERRLKYRLSETGKAELGLEGESGPIVELWRQLYRQPLSLYQIKRRFPQGERLWEKFHQRGWIEPVWAVKSSAPRREPVWRWSDKLSYDQALNMLPSQAHRLRQAIILLRSNNGAALQSTLEKEIKGIGSSLKNLLKKGWVEYEMVFKRKPIPFGEGLPETRLKEEVELTDEQSTILEQVKPYIHQRQFHIFLIHGVTGSGKTVVYRELVGEAINTGRKALVLVPEIGLTPQLAGRFRVKFGDKVAITHSGLTPAQRREVWQRVKRGDLSVIVGARSAIFTPFDDLGIIVVDEEQDESYKQEDNNPRYNARDCAIKLGQIARCPVVLGSATPDIVSFYNARKGRYTLLELKTRYQRVVPPQVWVVKWWGVKEGSLFSPQLKFRLQSCWENHLQAVILVNRRGFSTYVQCPSCGSVARCPNCDITLRYHRGNVKYVAADKTLSTIEGGNHTDYEISEDRMECHYCGYVQPVIDRCPHCGAERLLFKGTGTQRVVRELELLIPEARIARMDRDSIRSPSELHNLLLQLAQNEIDILIGTQMVAKGHDFPRIALVGVLMADLEWLHPDFRSLERAFRILVQAAGRAGRESPGEVVIQALDPTHLLLRWVQNQDYFALYNYEIPAREGLKYPPFSRLVSVWVKGENRDTVDKMASQLGKELKDKIKSAQILGPAIPLIERLEGEYRRRILIKFPPKITSEVRNDRFVVRDLLRNVARRGSSTHIKVWADVDPIEV